MSKTKQLSRRKFIEQSAVLGAATVVVPSLLQASANPVAPSKKVRVSIIGCGSVSTQYLPHISKSPHVELVSTCDIIPERAQKAAEQYGIKHWYPHIDQLLAGEPFELLLNLTDMQEHGRLNKLALNAGRNVWSEKPMANTYAEGKALLDLAKSKGLRIWGAPAVVNSPQFAFMAEQIKAGKLGRVAAAHAHYGHLGPTWSAFFYEKGGGSLPDLGVYNLATLTGLLGPVRYITAMTSIVTPKRKTDNKGEIAVEAEDNAIVLMDHGKGIISSVQCGFNYFDPYGHEGKGQEKPTISIWGSGGNMNLIGYDWAPFGVDMATLENEKTVRHVPDPGAYVWQMGATVIAEFMAGASGEPRIQAEHALHVLEIIEAARKSASAGKRVKLSSTFRYPIL